MVNRIILTENKMKTIIVVFFIALSYSCQSQKEIHSNRTCNILKTNDIKEFDSVIKKMDTTKLFNDVFGQFQNVSNGILFYRLNSGNKYGYFTVFKERNSKIDCQKTSKNFEKNVIVSKNDNKTIVEEINTIKEPNSFYYEQCILDSTDFIYLLVIKKEGRIIAKYLCHGYNKFLKGDENIDMKSIKNLFEISYRYSFK